jgi:hypothetical protein
MKRGVSHREQKRRRKMRKLVFVLALLAPIGAHAQYYEPQRYYDYDAARSEAYRQDSLDAMNRNIITNQIARERGTALPPLGGLSGRRY